MSLDKKVIKDFVAAVNKKEETKTPTILTGTVHREGGTVSVKIDGSESLTPVSTVINVEDGERVTVIIENHKAMITGNLSSPAARGNEVEDLKVIVGDKVSTAELDAITAKVGKIDGDVANFKETTTEKLTAQDANIKKIDGDVANFKETTTEKLSANEANIKKIDGDVASFKETTTEKLKANSAAIGSLDSTFAIFKVATAEKFKANEASIEDLKTGKLSAKDADLKYANIDFSNIGKTAMEYFYAQSGLVKDVKIGDATITGELVGVTISGDLLKGNTVVADKLVIKGSDGLYYKLNTDGMVTEKEQTDYNSLNGQVIRAKSITATKIDVEDLVAFGATIGGFKISQNSIYSGVKETVGNTTRGIYMDNDGQFVFGDANQYVKFYKISEGKYKLAIAVEDLFIGSSNVADAIEDVKKTADNAASVASSASSAASTANSTANAAKSTAEGASKTASDAASIASAANQTAANAKSTADQAKSEADTANTNIIAITKRVTEAETSISKNKDEIAIRAKKTEVTEAINNSKTETDASIKVLSDKIASTVETTDNLGERMSKVEQDSGSWSVTLETANAAKSAADNASQTASSAKSAADKANENASSAAKTATNYMKFDNSGLTVGDLTASTLGRNVNIDNSSVNIRNGTNVLAQFAESLIEIGKNTSVSAVSFMNGTVKLIAQMETRNNIAFRNAYLLAQNTICIGAGSTDPASDKLASMLTVRKDLINEINADVTDTEGHAYMNIRGSKASVYSDGNAGWSSVNVIANKDTSQVELHTNGSNGYKKLINYSHGLYYYDNSTLLAAYNGRTPCLWDGGAWMFASQSVTLSAPISEQPHGILVIFALFDPTTNSLTNVMTNPFFVPKTAINYDYIFTMFWENAWQMCTKRVTIQNTCIIGNDQNKSAAFKANTGITTSPQYFVLRRVYGV